MSSTSSVDSLPVLYPTHDLVSVPGAGASGYLQCPDGRIVETTPLFPEMQSGSSVSSSEIGALKKLDELHRRFDRERQENQILKLAWEAAQVSMLASRARETEALEELQQERENNQKYFKEIVSMQGKIETLQENLRNAKCRLQFVKLQYNKKSSVVDY